MRSFAIVLVLAALPAGAAAASAGERLVVHDPWAIPAQGDLDIRTVSLSVDCLSLRARIVLAGRVRTNAIYSVRPELPGDSLATECEEVPRGDDHLSLQRREAAIEHSGRARRKNCELHRSGGRDGVRQGPVKFSVTAQGTNGRAPDDGPASAIRRPDVPSLIRGARKLNCALLGTEPHDLARPCRLLGGQRRGERLHRVLGAPDLRLRAGQRAGREVGEFLAQRASPHAVEHPASRSCPGWEAVAARRCRDSGTCPGCG